MITTLNANSTSKDKINYLNFKSFMHLTSPDTVRNLKKLNSVLRFAEFANKEAKRLENL